MRIYPGMLLEELKATYTALGQEHIFEGLNELSESELQAFISSLQTVDLPNMVSKLNEGLQSQSDATAEISAFNGPTVDITNVDMQRMIYELEDGVGNSSNPEITSAYKDGVLSIAKGEVAVLMLAGGQGSRLGFNHPKGMFPIDPASGASIFDLHSYRIHTLLKMARKAHPSMTPRLPWIVMTSAATHHDTKACFVENKYFGLPEADVIFFQQGQLPALAYVPVATAADDKAPQPLTVIDHPTRGRIQLKLVMEAPGKLALAPNGNGGLWADMAPVVASEPGLQYIHVVGVDNILMKIADPVMTGYMTHHKVDIMNKVIMKENPEEKVGVLASRHGQSVLVEYSEIKEKATERGPDGNLLFCNGSIASIMFTRKAIQQAIANAHDLPWHLAEGKNVACNARMAAVMGVSQGPKPGKVEATKCELFLFDAFPYVKDIGAIRGLREHEFAPVKNSNDAGFDSPATARALLSQYNHKLLDGAGIKVPSTIPDDAMLVGVTEATYFGENLRSVDVSTLNGTVHTARL